MGLNAHLSPLYEGWLFTLASSVTVWSNYTFDFVRAWTSRHTTSPYHQILMLSKCLMNWERESTDLQFGPLNITALYDVLSDRSHNPRYNNPPTELKVKIFILGNMQ